MIVFGMLGKIGAVFVTIPDPIVGGVFMVMFGKTSFYYRSGMCGPQCFMVMFGKTSFSYRSEMFGPQCFMVMSDNTNLCDHSTASGQWSLCVSCFP